jgi:hypothetical protein
MMKETTMSMTEETVLDKITKLLAKAERTDNPHEAEVFSAKATELMMQWAIDDAVLEAHRAVGSKPDPIVQRWIACTGSWWKAYQILAAGVGRGFGFKILVQDWSREKGINGYTIWVGFESDVHKAEMLYASLLNQCVAAQKEFMIQWKKDFPPFASHKMETFKARRSFIIGFADTVRTRITESRKVAVRKVEKTDTSVALVLVSRQDQLEVAYTEMFPRTTKGRASRMHAGVGGYKAGQAAGRQAGLATTQLGGNSAKAIGR